MPARRRPNMHDGPSFKLLRASFYYICLFSFLLLGSSFNWTSCIKIFTQFVPRVGLVVLSTPVTNSVTKDGNQWIPGIRINSKHYAVNPFSTVWALSQSMIRSLNSVRQSRIPPRPVETRLAEKDSTRRPLNIYYADLFYGIRWNVGLFQLDGWWGVHHIFLTGWGP